MNTTRRKFFTRLLGAAAAVPVLLIGSSTRAAQTGALDQDRIDRINVDLSNLIRRFRASMVESDRPTQNRSQVATSLSELWPKPSAA